MSRIGSKPVPVPPTVKVAIANSTIEISHKDDGRKLFDERPILGFDIRKLGLAVGSLGEGSKQVMHGGSGLLTAIPMKIDLSESSQYGLGLLRA